MSKNQEQRVCLKFCVANGISCTESLKMMKKTFGDKCISRTRFYNWYKVFKEGRESVEDLPRSGRPLTSTKEENLTKVKNIILRNGRITERDLSKEVGIPIGSVHRLLVDVLSLKRVEFCFVPKELNTMQKENRKALSLQMISETSNNPLFMKRIITGDVLWLLEYKDDLNDEQFDEPQGDVSKMMKPRLTHSKTELVLTVFFDCHGIVHVEFASPGEISNNAYYVAVLKRLRESLCTKRQNLWKDNSWILHLNALPSHTSLQMYEFLAENSIKAIPHSQNSPDLSPCDFFLFPKLRLTLRVKRFDSIEALKENALKELKKIPSTAYEKCFKEWLKRWHMCVLNDGDYFEGDKTNYFSDEK